MVSPETNANKYIVETETNTYYSNEMESIDGATPNPTHLSLIGELESPLDPLRLPPPRESIEPDIDIVVYDSPLAYLLKYELAKEKQPPANPERGWHVEYKRKLEKKTLE